MLGGLVPCPVLVRLAVPIPLAMHRLGPAGAGHRWGFDKGGHLLGTPQLAHRGAEVRGCGPEPRAFRPREGEVAEVAKHLIDRRGESRSLEP